MDQPARKIAILGSTGSIGRSALDVVAASAGRLEIVALSAHRRLSELCEQARTFQPRYVAATDEEAATGFDWSGLPRQTEVLLGQKGLAKIARLPEVDVVLSGVVGSIGLVGTWAAVEAGKTVALANKETLVMAGQQVMRLAEERGARILPVDSEHSGIFQLLECGPPESGPAAGRREIPGSQGEAAQDGDLRSATPAYAGRRDDVARIILTASGGPFRLWTREQMDDATIADALAHPTWHMGDKITIDSATMMNKALEIIEARWLFDLVPERIDVVVHPQSIVHSLVEFIDGSVVAQLSPPDMRLPIQYALTWPRRRLSPARKLDFRQAMRLEFEPPDAERFPALRLGREVAAAGGTAGAVLNAANEAAVASFLRGEIGFTEIVAACEAVLQTHSFSASPTLDELLKLDVWARQEITRWILA